MSWFTLMDEPGGLQSDPILAGATAVFALSALFAGGVLVLDRLGQSGTTN